MNEQKKESFLKKLFGGGKKSCNCGTSIEEVPGEKVDSTNTVKKSKKKTENNCCGS